ncbi:MAG: SPOR domain-containing protein [Hyphomicrobiaceae bacterium]|nr:SPOR domain-containing protein [Hyphomicrobiaceae bacterium]
MTVERPDDVRVRQGPPHAELRGRRRSGLVRSGFLGVLCGAAIICALAAVAPACAQAPTGRNAVVAGIKSYDAGQAPKAIATLSEAINAGGLSSQDLAKALYYRGLAYRKQKQPALAISDLTSAIWLKDGLSESERAAALQTRGAAYAEAGLKDPGPPAGMPTGGPVATPAAVPGAAPAPTGAVPTQVAAARPPSSSPAAPASNWLTDASPAASEPGSASPLGGVQNFFSNLFGGGAGTPSGTPSAAAPGAGEASAIETSSTGPAPAARPPAPAPGPVVAGPVTSGWSSGMDVKAAAERQKPKVAAVAPPAAPAAAAPAGALSLRVAAVRSRTEADRIAGELAARHGRTIGARVPTIEEAVFGNMGTFYQVNVGPFASAAETDGVCKALKTSGYDCFVVKN